MERSNKSGLGICITFLFCLFSAGSAYGQDFEVINEGNDEAAPAKTTKKDQTNSTESHNKGSKEKRSYPTIKYPPGYYEGVFLISVMGGRALAPSGSYINHERAYDHTLGLLVTNDTYKNPAIPKYDGIVSPYYDSEYTPGYTYQFELEYGSFPHFGFGFTLMQFSVKSVRQRALNAAYAPAPIIEAMPSNGVLFFGTSALFLATYHPFEKSVFDPYVAMRAGFTGYNGQAHSGLLLNPSRLSDKVQNGLGMGAGPALGVNVHFSRYVGIKAEVMYFAQSLKSDQFSSRGLNTYMAQIGFIVNTNQFSGDDE